MDTIAFLPLVKAYPALSKAYGEVSCIAGVRTDAPDGPSWIRLYPVPFRALDSQSQFAKYQPMTVAVATHGGDRRPETRRPDRDSIQVTGDVITTANAWERRRRFVEPLMAESMCEIQERQRADGTSLGVFRPAEVLDIVIAPANVSKEKQDLARAWAAQPSLLDGLADDEQGLQREALELVPWTFKYHYVCSRSGCPSHTQSIVDWEIATSYRRVRDSSDWQERIKDRWIGDLCASDRDTAFFVGNMHQHLASFLVLGVWWPPSREEQLSLSGV